MSWRHIGGVLLVVTSGKSKQTLWKCSFKFGVNCMSCYYKAFCVLNLSISFKGLIDKEFCVLHVQSNTTIFYLVVQ